MKPKEISWTKNIANSKIHDALEEACVDCYDEHEQSSGLTTMAAEQLAFPFQAEVLGEIVEVVDACCPKFDPLGLDLIVVHKGKQYAVAAHNVELLKPLPEGHIYLAAYLEWKSNQ